MYKITWNSPIGNSIDNVHKYPSKRQQQNEISQQNYIHCSNKDETGFYNDD